MNLDKINDIKNNSGELFKQNKKVIKRYCFYYSNYYNIDFNDLLSQSNEIFINCIKKYYHNQISFNDFFRNQLKKYLRFYCLNEIRNSYKQQKLQQKLKIEYSNVVNEIDLKNENIEFTCSNEIKKIITEIIEFCMNPDFMKLLQPYITIKKQKKIKPSAYIIKYYFNNKYGYSHNKLDQAIFGIRNILKEQMI